MTSNRTIVSAVPLRSSILALSLSLLAACGGAQNNAAVQNGATAAATPAVPADASPVRASLAEFDGVCGRPMDRDGYSAAASAAGWEAFEVTPDSQLGQVLSVGQRMAREMLAQSGRTGEIQTEYSTFRKTTNGRELQLVVTDMQIPGMPSNLECRLYDFTAPLPTDAEIASWTSAPAQRVNEQGMIGWAWQPPFRQGFYRIDVSHVAASAPIRAQIPMLGLSVTALLPPRQAPSQNPNPPGDTE